MENNVDFDALARKTNESGGAMEDLNNLFGAAFALDEWLFIARGVLPNVNPYIASRADYMDGQQMIRAFTDSKHLVQFAKENNLTNADGGAEMLSIPIGGIVEYLEQFIQHGVGGVWFNSDTQSDGFSMPLKQLRPIKEHLAKIGWKSVNEPTNPDLPHNSGFVSPLTAQKTGEQKPPMEVVAVVINDGLMLPSGFFKASTYACNFYCLVPRTWTEGGKLKDVLLERFYEKFYGATWRAGNSDGSRYVVDSSFSTVLTPEDLQGVNWTTLENDEKNHYWFYAADANGEIKSVKPPEFQQEFIASHQTPTPTSSSAPPTSNLENWGFAKTPDGDTEQRIKIFKTGNVKFGSSLVPLYSTFAPLLADYQGSGEFEKIFNFAPEAISNYKESFVANGHGNYFRMRTFQYTSPNDVADAMTIDSNQLRHIQTGATLLVSFTLLTMPSTSSAALYFGFEGGRSEVEKLLKAVTPALEAAGFVDGQKENNSPAQSATDDDKNAGDYINWFRRGTIQPDTSFKPFFRAIAPLLADYAGAGEFEFSFATGSDDPGMRDLFEDVSSNSHGAYLKYRSYIFEPYEMQMIGSNRLTNVRTGEKLRIQLTMHKNLAERKTTLIVVFVGRSATVETLENAVKSALDDAEYKVQLQTKKAATTETLQSIGVQG